MTVFSVMSHSWICKLCFRQTLLRRLVSPNTTNQEHSNPRKYKYSDSMRRTASKFPVNDLNFSKNISVIESEGNLTQQWSKLFKCFKFCPPGRNTLLSRHCFGRINLLGGLSRWRRGYTFETIPFFGVYVPGESGRHPYGHRN